MSGGDQNHRVSWRGAATTTPSVSEEGRQVTNDETASADAGEGLTDNKIRLAISEIANDVYEDDPDKAHRIIRWRDDMGPDVLREIVDRLAALRQTSSEPVAWRWEQWSSLVGAWSPRLTYDKPDPDGRCVRSVQPLFAAPTAPEHAAGERVRVLEAALRECLSVFADPRFTDRGGYADMIRAALNPQSQEKGV